MVKKLVCCLIVIAVILGIVSGCRLGINKKVDKINHDIHINKRIYRSMEGIKKNGKNVDIDSIVVEDGVIE